MSTDLLGDPIPETPAITAPLPWRVFYVNDMEFWIARTLDDLRAAYSEEFGAGTWAQCEADVYELTEQQLDDFQVAITDENDDRTGDTRPFRAELDERIRCGLSAPEFFAGEE